MADLAPERAARVRRVAAPAREPRGDHGPFLRRIEDRQVGGLTGLDRAAVTVGDAGDRRRLPTERGDDVGEGHVELGDRHCQCRLETEHPWWRLVERELLLVWRVGCVVGGDRVDRAVGEPGLDRLDVGRGAQRRVHLEQWVVAGEQFVGEREVMRRGLRRDGQALRLRLPHELHRARRAQVEEVHRGSGQSHELDVTEQHQLLGERRPARQPQPAAARTLVHHRSLGERRHLAVLRQHHTERLRVLERAPHQ